MDSINLPNVESKEQITAPEVQEIVNTADPVIDEAESIFIEKPKEVEVDAQPVVKKKEKPAKNN